jgi:hypothetical protein
MEMDTRREVHHTKRLSNIVQGALQEVSLRADLESES